MDFRCTIYENSILINKVNTSLYGISPEVWVPIFVLLLGYLINELFVKWRKYRECNLLKIAIIELLTSTQKYITDFSNNVKKLAENIEKSDKFNPQSFEIINLPPDNLTSLSFDKLIETFILKLDVNREERKNRMASKHLFNFLSLLKGFRDSYTVTINCYTEYRNECYTCIKEWNQKWPLIKEDISKNLNIFTPNSPEYHFYITLKNALDILEKESKTTEELSISQLSSFFEKCLYASYKGKNQSIICTITSLQQIHNIFLQVFKQKDIFKTFLKQVSYLNGIKDELEKIIEFYKKHKIRFFGISSISN